MGTFVKVPTDSKTMFFYCTLLKKCPNPKTICPWHIVFGFGTNNENFVKFNLVNINIEP